MRKTNYGKALDREECENLLAETKKRWHQMKTGEITFSQKLGKFYRERGYLSFKQKMKLESFIEKYEPESED